MLPLAGNISFVLVEEPHILATAPRVLCQKAHNRQKGQNRQVMMWCADDEVFSLFASRHDANKNTSGQHEVFDAFSSGHSDFSLDLAYSASGNLDERLLELTNSTGYNIVQRNGQRVFGGPPPDWFGDAPDSGCEVFVGKLPRDCFEDELVPIFSKIGRIYELRLMMDFSGTNRGYLFVRYTNCEEANRAVQLLNNFEIRPNRHLGVVHSVDNRRLLVSGFPRALSNGQLKVELERVTDGLRVVVVPPQPFNAAPFAFVEYESHRAAALARRSLMTGKIALMGHSITRVDWADPVSDGEAIPEAVFPCSTHSFARSLFVRNIPATATEAKIKSAFEELVGAGQVWTVTRAPRHALVAFRDHEVAERALFLSRRFYIEGALINVTWARTGDRSSPINPDGHRSDTIKDLAPFAHVYDHCNNDEHAQGPLGVRRMIKKTTYQCPTSMNGLSMTTNLPPFPNAWNVEPVWINESSFLQH